MPQKTPPPAPRRAVAADNSGATLSAAMTLGVVGLMLCGAPLAVSWQRARFAEQLARHAAEIPGGAARLEVRRLAERGVETIGALVRLAATTSSAAEPAREAVDNQVAAWLMEYRSTGNAANLGHRVGVLTRALAANVERFDAAGVAWAQRVALELAPSCDRLTPRQASAILADCDTVLAASVDAKTIDAADVPLAEAVSAEAAAPPAQPGERPANEPPAAQPLASADAGPTSSRIIQDGTLRFLPPQTPGTAATLPSVAPLPEPEAGVIPAAPLATVPAAQSLPIPEHDAAVVDVAPPQRQRALLRRYRMMPERQLTTALAQAGPQEALLIQQALRERRAAVTARGPQGPRPQTPAGGAEPLADRVSKLPSADARRLLRELATDAAGDAETRLQALTLLATSGDPELAAIARQRALEDADPRVADLAQRILRDSAPAR